MCVPTDLAKIQRRLDEGLQRVDATYFVLRAMCEPDWLDVTDEETAQKLHGRLHEMFAGSEPGGHPPLIRKILADEGDQASKAERVRELLSVARDQGARAEEFVCVASRWEIIAGLFWSDYIEHLPRPLREKMAREQDDLSKLLSLWFRPSSEKAYDELSERIRRTVDEDGGWRVYYWDAIRTFLPDWRMKPHWPDVDQARKKLDAVCQAFREEGRTDFEPTDAEIQEAAIQIVRSYEPRREDSSDGLFAARVADGDLELSDVLRPQPLVAAVGRALEPVSVSKESIRDNLRQLVERGRLTRREINGRIYYYTADPRGTPPRSGKPAARLEGFPQFVPTEIDLLVLATLAQSRTPMHHYELATETHRSRNTIGRDVSRLRENGLVYYPKGERNGVTITPEGQAIVREAESGS